MKLSGSTFAWFAGIGLAAMVSNSLAGTVTYSQRNRSLDFSVNPSTEVLHPSSRRTVSGRSRAEFRVLAPASSRVAISPAAITITETNAKTIASPKVTDPRWHRAPDALTIRAVRLTEQAALQPAERRAALFAKRQEPASTTSRVTIGRTPLPDRAGTAQFNRFVFRRQPSTEKPLLLPVVPAAEPVRPDLAR